MPKFLRDFICNKAHYKGSPGGDLIDWLTAFVKELIRYLSLKFVSDIHLIVFDNVSQRLRDN